MQPHVHQLMAVHKKIMCRVAGRSCEIYNRIDLS